jgi:hypothetical protein
MSEKKKKSSSSKKSKANVDAPVADVVAAAVVDAVVADEVCCSLKNERGVIFLVLFFFVLNLFGWFDGFVLICFSF